MDLKIGRVRRKVIFGDEEDEFGDSDDENDEEMFEGDSLENSFSDDEIEKEEDVEMVDKEYMIGKGVKRQRFEEMEEDVEVDLLVFVDSDDDFERSLEEEEVEEVDESSEEEDFVLEGERDILEFKVVGEGSKVGLSDSLNLEKFLIMKKVIFIILDLGYCIVEEVFVFEDEFEESFFFSIEGEDLENEEVIRKKILEFFQVVSGQKLGLENLINEISDVEDLFREEESYKEENKFFIEILGMFKFNLIVILNLILKMFYKQSLYLGVCCFGDFISSLDIVFYKRILG